MNMRIGIIGANGHVGLEISLLFARDHHTVIPIVRNELAGTFLRKQGLVPRIADISDAEDARPALRDLDLIVIATNATDVGGPSRLGLRSQAQCR